MVVGVLAVGLQQVVVHVLDRDAGPDPVQAQGFELQHDHGAGGVLGQRLVDREGDLRTGLHLAGDQVRLDELLRHVPCHGQAATPGLAW